jgi:hypothetical protein
MPVTLIADSGATKAEWVLFNNGKKETLFTQGISPYFLNTQQIAELVQNELAKKLKNVVVDEVDYYGTGCASPENANSVKKSIEKSFSQRNYTSSNRFNGCGPFRLRTRKRDCMHFGHRF